MGEVAESTNSQYTNFAGKKAVFYQKSLSRNIFPFKGKNSCEGGESDAAAAVVLEEKVLTSALLTPAQTTNVSY